MPYLKCCSVLKQAQDGPKKVSHAWPTGKVLKNPDAQPVILMTADSADVRCEDKMNPCPDTFKVSQKPMTQLCLVICLFALIPDLRNIVQSWFMN